MAVGDVFPRRNLPDSPGASAIPWGRMVEDRTISNEQTLEMLQQSVQAQNRSNASSLQLLSDAISQIPITRSTSNFVTDFPIPGESGVSSTKTARVVVVPPQGRTSLNVYAIGGVRIYENVVPPVAFAAAIIRMYSLETDELITFGGSAPTVRSPQNVSTFHSATPIFATRRTIPVGGVYLSLEIDSTLPANFPLDDRNLAELIVQTSFL